MRSTAFLSLLSVATIASALPMDSVDSPAIVGRADDGQYHWNQPAAGEQADVPSWQAEKVPDATPDVSGKTASVAGGWDAKPTSVAAGEWAATPSTAVEPDTAVGADTGKQLAGVEETTGDEAPAQSTGGGESSGGSAGSGAYKEYHGNGDNWPKKSAWVGSFDAM